MTTGEVITAVAAHHLNVGGTDGTYRKARLRALFHLQALAKKAHGAYPWQFRLASGTVALAAGDGYGQLPANFGMWGPKTEVFIDAVRFQLRYRDPKVLFRMRQLETGTSDRPQFYCERGETVGGRRYLHVHKTNAGALTIDVDNYLTKTPVLVDFPYAPTTAEGAAGNLSGAYTWRCTFVTADGETEGGIVSSSRTVSSKQVTVTLPIAYRTLDPDQVHTVVTSRKLYRTVASGTVYKLVATISDNTTTSYTDNTADGSLGATCPAPGDSGVVTGLEEFPSEWHETLFYDGLVARMMGGQADLREQQQDVKFMAALRDAWASQHQGQNRVMRLPRYGSSQYRVR